MNKYTLERVMEIWNNDTYYHYEVGEDRDCLDLVEIREYDENNKVSARLTFEKEAALKIGQAILEYCNDERNFNKR